MRIFRYAPRRYRAMVGHENGGADMTPQSHAAFIKWLESEIALAKHIRKKPSNFMLDDYQDGKDAGRLAALKDVREYFTG